MPRSSSAIEGVAYGAQVAGKVHRELKRIGGVTPPREFVLTDRAAIADQAEGSPKDGMGCGCRPILAGRRQLR